MNNQLPQKFLFLKENRLLTQEDYRRVFSKGARKNSLYLTAIVQSNQNNIPRLGLRISKKCVKRATDRNRIKRVVRESFRLNQHQLNSLDIVIISKKGIGSLSNIELKKCLESLLTSI